jgi:ElaB/YqjD/DUF883 family membrane-anchored ribosome-binding protein
MSVATRTKDNGKEPGATAKEIQADLQALQDDVAKLTRQLGELVAAKGTAAWQRTQANVNDIIADAQNKGTDAVDAMRDMSGDVVDAIEDSVHRRPYTTLAIAVGVGFLVGATWRR